MTDAAAFFLFFFIFAEISSVVTTANLGLQLLIPYSQPTMSTKPSTELDAAVLAYLVKRGYTKTVKSLEKEAGVKLLPGQEDKLEDVWAATAVAAVAATLCV